ncbi:MAG TPA: diguanylate cyclase [Candidatus Limnocylindria bacterium]|nr:diguanylate cyclase [Candidatus Limnocylindria bacterium]
MARLAGRAGLLAFLLGLALASAVPALAVPSERGVFVLHVTRNGRAFVVGPQRVERMHVTVRGETSTVGQAIPLGASLLGHGVTAVQLPDDLRPDEPITVRLEPAHAGVPRILADDPSTDIAVAAGRADGIMLGVLLAVLLLQIAGWTISREPSVPFYALYVVTLGLTELLRDQLLPLPHAIPALPMLVLLDCINGLGSIGFIAVYLRLWRDDRRLLWVMIAAIAPAFFGALAFALVPALQPHSEAYRAPILLVGSIVLVAIALVRARRFPPALTLASALAFVTLGVVYRATRVLTPFHEPFLDRWLFEIATTLDALAFGLAVIVRARYVVQERRKLEERLDEATTAADHDPLTGALNRRGLNARVAAIASGALFYVDLDGFKAINDRFGHLAGDHILVEVAGVLRRLAPRGALVARVGGDEFVVVTRENGTPPDVLANRFAAAIAAIQTPARLRGDGFGASLGFVSLDGMSFENALRIADAKAYRAKSRKTNGERYTTTLP